MPVIGFCNHGRLLGHTRLGNQKCHSPSLTGRTSAIRYQKGRSGTVIDPLVPWHSVAQAWAFSTGCRAPLLSVISASLPRLAYPGPPLQSAPLTLFVSSWTTLFYLPRHSPFASPLTAHLPDFPLSHSIRQEEFFPYREHGSKGRRLGRRPQRGFCRAQCPAPWDCGTHRVILPAAPSTFCY